MKTKSAIVVTLATCLLIFNAFVVNASGFTLYLTRHYEKQPDKINPALTIQGQQRAAVLAEFFSDKSLNAVYSTPYKRTQDTAQPVADAKGLNVTSYDPRRLDEFASMLLNAGENVLVVGHSNTTPELIKKLNGAPSKIEETQYGDLFILSIQKRGVSQSHVMIAPE
ncbi:phosphoglycerate mutase family protein [Aestuariibacter salexigens]|uniref:phosphoglycerate mutase family protein n=1 Tax=Aestuariibacter salexigens TaxID=226010 RepID=UPI00041E02C1|nr:phosphoglycerate mutase family protein [Aestuariibacter salexigens]